MIILLDTSTSVCRLVLIDGDKRFATEWEAGHDLARGLLAYLRDRLADHDKTFHDITGVGVFKGPGSFTGLRIGITVLNTLADTEKLPIVGTTGETWQAEALDRLGRGESDQIVLPLYGREANITAPRK